MLQVGAIIKVADNSGAKNLKVIGIPGHLREDLQLLVMLLLWL